MIEVEKKFSIDEAVIKRIEVDAEYISTVVYHDALFDDDHYSLISKDIWLRTRNGQVELKLPETDHSAGVDVYSEISGEDNVIKALDVRDLSSYKPISKLTTIRKKFKLGEFNIDIDSVSSELDDFVYDLMEVELMVASKDEIDFAMKRISAFANEYGLTNSADGKNIAYFKKHRPDVLRYFHV